MAIRKLLTVNGVMRSLVEELMEDGVVQPLSIRFTMAALWADLARLAAEPIPSDVLALIDDDPEPPPCGPSAAAYPASDDGGSTAGGCKSS